MAIDIQAALEEISRIEKLQAQVELRMQQYKEEERAFKARLEKFGITEAELQAKIGSLSASIQEKLTRIAAMGKAGDNV